MHLYSQYLKEKQDNKRISTLIRFVSISFLATFLYFLFSVSYTANPSIVIFNYLALLTSVSGILFYKMSELPNMVLNIKEEGDSADFFQLEPTQRQTILNSICEGRNQSVEGLDLKALNAKEINTLLRLETRTNWKLIGKIYFMIYILTVVGFCSHLAYLYFTTGFE